LCWDEDKQSRSKKRQLFGKGFSPEKKAAEIEEGGDYVRSVRRSGLYSRIQELEAIEVKVAKNLFSTISRCLQS
jgi:hypothetical protein